MGRTKKTPMVWTEAHDEDAFVSTWTSQANPRLFSTAVNVPSTGGNSISALGNNVLVVAADKPVAEDSRGEKPANDDKYSGSIDAIDNTHILLSENIHTKRQNQFKDTMSVQNISAMNNPSLPSLVADLNHLTPQRALTQANFEGYDLNDETPWKDASTCFTTSLSSHRSSEFVDNLNSDEEAKDRFSNLARAQHTDNIEDQYGRPNQENNGGVDPEATVEARKDISWSSSSSTLISLRSSDFEDLDRTIMVDQENTENPNNNESVAPRVSGSKLGRGQACTRCRGLKKKCSVGATCASCAKAGVQCLRPL